MTLDLTKLREAAERATPGPWEAAERGDYTDFGGHSRVIIGDERRIAVVHHSGSDENEATATVIALANPATILALIERVERAEREIERLSEALEPFAREAAQWGNAVADDAMPVVLEIGHWDGRYYGSRAVYTIGDLRRARAALSQDKEGGT